MDQLAQTSLEALRLDFPTWVIGVIGPRWIGFWDDGEGQQTHTERDNPDSLRERLEFFQARMARS